MAMTKQQIAIKCCYAGRRLPPKPPRDKMVLDGKVKLTPRRREILWHVAYTECIWWRLERNWRGAGRWRNDKAFKPYLAATQIEQIIAYLKRHKLLRFSPASVNPYVTSRDGFTPILIITPRGMDALLECVKHPTDNIRLAISII